ncbi:MAG: hypothetical protein WCK11_00710 [Candidatus Falkowbacteria bacterium]
MKSDNLQNIDKVTAEYYQRISISNRAEAITKRVINRIYRRQINWLRLKISGTIFAISFCVWGGISAGTMAWQAFQQSEIATISSLLFTDFNSVMANGLDYVWLYLESLPALEILYVLTALFVLLSLVKLLGFELKQKQRLMY